MNDPNSILVLTSTFPRWKDDSDPPFVFELCRRLAADFPVTVLAPAYPGSRSEEVLAGVRVVRFRYFFASLERLSYGQGGGILQRIRRNPVYGFLVPFFLAGQLCACIRMLRKERFGLVHAHWIIPQGVLALMSRAISRRRLPIIATAHGGDLYGLQGAVMNRIRSAVLHRAEAVTVVSTAMKKDLLKSGVLPAAVSVIPMGTDLLTCFTPGKTRPDSNLVLFVGRLVEVKGCRFLVEAWPEILSRCPMARLRIVGDGPERPRLEKRCRELKVAASVEFLGALAQKSLPALYRSAAVAVFPSAVTRGGIQEGFGLVLVEALGCECAVVVTDFSAMKDIVENGETGLVVAQQDSSQIAQAVTRLLADPALRLRLGQKGRRHVLNRFDWKIIADRYRALIEAVTQGRPAASGG